MEERQDQQPLHPRPFGFAKPEEIESFAGWRVLIRSGGLHLGMFEQHDADQALLTAKPETMTARKRGEGYLYDALADKYEAATNKRVSRGALAGAAVFDSAPDSFLLEPLSEEEIKGSKTSDEPEVILQPADLLEILRMRM